MRLNFSSGLGTRSRFGLGLGGLILSSLLFAALFMISPAKVQAAGSTISGRVYDRDTGQSLAGAIVVAGYNSFQLATKTDSNGNYSFSNVPSAKNLDIISFLPGYTYLLQNRDVTEGENIVLNFGVIVQPDPDLVPTVSNALISTISAEPGQTVTFSLHAKAGSEVPLSPEIMAMNPVLGRSVLLKPSGGDLWTGTWKIPANVPDGTYAWTFFAVDEACREPVAFPVVNLGITAPHYFEATQKTVPGIFYYYWQQHGGLSIYGYPISEAKEEVSPTDRKTYLTQYFERNRFEYHPEFAGTSSEVELGLLGRQVTAGRENEPPFQPIAAFISTPTRTYFQATGHSLGNGFKAFWEQHGGLAQFGYPISEEFSEKNPADGKTYTVQYFERARFEYHPEFMGTPYEVELGLLGKQIYNGQ